MRPNISNVVLMMRNGAVTHTLLDMGTALRWTFVHRGEGVRNVNGRPNGNIAPPGYYMLYHLKWRGRYIGGGNAAGAWRRTTCAAERHHNQPNVGK